jgi:DNA-binding transcriptional ArsR family regulator
MELARPFAMSQPAISKHLQVLERAGLISRGRDAQRRPCRIEAQPLAEAGRWRLRNGEGGR